MNSESGFEVWSRESLASLRRHGADRFEDLPEIEKTRLHVLAAAAWPAVGRLHKQAAEVSAGLTPDQVEQVWPQIAPELDVSREEAVQLANYRTAMRALEALWQMAKQPATPHPLGHVIRALDPPAPQA